MPSSYTIIGWILLVYANAHENTGSRDQWWLTPRHPVRVIKYETEWEQFLFMPAVAIEAIFRQKEIVPYYAPRVRGEERS